MKLLSLFTLTSALLLTLISAESPESSAGKFRRKSTVRMQGEPVRGRKQTPPPPPPPRSYTRPKAEDSYAKLMKDFEASAGRAGDWVRKATTPQPQGDRRKSILSDEAIAKINQNEKPNNKRSASFADIMKGITEDPEIQKMSKDLAAQFTGKTDSPNKLPNMEELLKTPEAQAVAERVKSSVQEMLGGEKELKAIREKTQDLLGLKLGDKKGAAVPDMDALLKSPDSIAEMGKTINSLLKDEKSVERLRQLSEQFLNPSKDKKDGKAYDGLDDIFKDIDRLSKSMKKQQAQQKRKAAFSDSDDDDFTSYDDDFDDSWFGQRRRKGKSYL